MYNVRYKWNEETRYYLDFPVPRRHIAEKAAKSFTDRYVGKPFPNGKGFYPVTDVEVVSVGVIEVDDLYEQLGPPIAC